jgi:hypothetical protein
MHVVFDLDNKHQNFQGEGIQYYSTKSFNCFLDNHDIISMSMDHG